MTDKERCRAIIRPGPNFRGCQQLPPDLLDKHTIQHSLCRVEFNDALCVQNAVGIVVENWTNQRLEFPEVEVEAGGQDRWYQPAAVPPHTRDLALLAHSTRGDHAQVLLVNSLNKHENTQHYVWFITSALMNCRAACAGWWRTPGPGFTSVWPGGPGRGLCGPRPPSLTPASSTPVWRSRAQHS